jgi:hypothetical protein
MSVAIPSHLDLPHREPGLPTPLPVLAPLLNLVEVAAVGIEWIVGFFGDQPG